MIYKICYDIINPINKRTETGTMATSHEWEEANNLLEKGKKPPYGVVVIKGAKQTPLLSESFLAAASYQETSKILVHAAISNQVDNLEGLKENIILGHKIPVGTSSNYEQDSKYDLLDLNELFYEQ